MKHAFLTALCLTVLLTGCATPPPQPPAGQTRSPAALTDWVITGKLGVTRGKRRDFVAINRWTQSGDRYDIRLSSTLFGLGAARLSGTSGHILLEQGEERYLADNPDALLEEALGLPLPLQALYWWVRGLPDPGQPEVRVESSADGQARTFMQNGWHVKLSRFHSAQGYKLPGRIDLIRDNLHIRMVITSWHLS